MSQAFLLRGVRQAHDGTSILHDIDLEIQRGQITALIGPSGAGKSALLRLLNRLSDPVAGEIMYSGRPIADYPIGELRRRVGFVFQTPVVFPGTVRDNLLVAAEIVCTPSAEIPARLEESLRLAEVDHDLADRDATRLSVGQKQRVNIARALMTAPETLLMDEPTASLDPETADKLGRTIACLSSERGLTVVAVTHRLAEARELSDHVIMLDAGSVVEAGPTTELFEKSSHPRLRAFLESVG